MKLYPMPMHLHAACEPSASIGAHMHWARRLGIRHLFLTEHDSRIGVKRRPLTHFFFPKRKLFCELPRGIRAGLRPEGENSGGHAFSEDAEGIALTLRAGMGEREVMVFSSVGKCHAEPLASDVTVTLTGEAVLSGDATLAVEFILSAQPPHLAPARLVYFLGNAPKPEVGCRYLPFPERDGDGAYRFSLSADVTPEIGGLDNALTNIRFSLISGLGEATLTLRALDFHRRLGGEETRQALAALADALGRAYAVTPFVTFEISEAGHHKNCYSTAVPLIDYPAHGYAVTQEEAIAHVLSHGGIFGYNHAFTEWRACEPSEEEKDRIVAYAAEELAASEVFGASLLEVCFPSGKEDFACHHYLRLWDLLSQSGIFITGDGDSDNHHATADGWLYGNNFVTFVGLPDGVEPTEESLVSALVRGSCFAADPTACRHMSLTAEGRPMGSILVGDAVTVEFSADRIAAGGYAVRIVNGREDGRIGIREGSVRDTYTLAATELYDFVRYEIRRHDGRLLGLTNPIYLVGDAALVPERARGRL